MYYDTNSLRRHSERLEGFERDRGWCSVEATNPDKKIQLNTVVDIQLQPLTDKPNRRVRPQTYPSPPTHTHSSTNFSPLPPNDPNEMCKTKHVSRDNTSSFCYIGILYLRDNDFLGLILDTML